MQVDLLALQQPDSPRPNETVCDESKRSSQRLIGFSKWATTARRVIEAHSSHTHPILIEGETGTGKSYIAQLIHESSSRSHSPFIAVSVAALSLESAEGALFGSVKPLSAGRRQSSRGLLQKANGGTLYIDGAVNFSRALESDLWRFIHRGEFRRTDDSSYDYADVRIILGSNHEPPEDGWSLHIEDRMTVPPLRERKADIEPLCRHFIREFCRKTNRELRRLSREALDMMRGYPWPGNISELKRVIEFSVRQSEPPPISAAQLPAHMTGHSTLIANTVDKPKLSLNDELVAFERALLIQALKKSGGVQSRAAKLLGVKPTTLNRKVKLYAIDWDIRSLSH
jgi:DNA-binding NtrC family response regulator